MADNNQKSKYKKIFIPIAIISLIVIVFIIAHFFSGNKLVRGVKWGQSVNSVVKQEQKNDSSVDISVADNQIFISRVTIFDIGGAKLWYFFEDNKLSDGTLWEGQIALYFRWTCLPDCAVPELDADYRRNKSRLS